MPKAFVPLGGGISDPGNQVAIVKLDRNTVRYVTVGIHPQRVVAHEPSGLVFVCNQYSNYISIIDARVDQLLRAGGFAVEIPTDFYCADLLVVEREPAFGEVDELFLYVANERRASVMKYSIDVLRDVNDNVSDVRVNPPPGREDQPHVPIAEITGVGANPYRLHLNETQTQIFVASNRGGELSKLDISSDQVFRHVSLNAPTLGVVEIDDKVYVPTTTPFRGLPSASGVIPDDLDFGPADVIGVDGEVHEGHPGSLFDQTDSYNFEDLRSGVAQLNNTLQGGIDYHTDNNEADAFFGDTQKVLAGALPWDIQRTVTGDRVFVVLFGSDMVQELSIGNGEFRLQPQGGLIFQTAELPTAAALDEDGNRLLVATMGGEVLQVFDLDDGALLASINLGFAAPRYPATIMEAGEYFFATARWSNDGRKACASCHIDRLLTDGVGYAGGTAAPSAVQQVKPIYNLMETDMYFWNGSFANNSNASLAFAAQSRTNCELILYGLVEGFNADPAARTGDPFNYTSGSDDGNCRPDTNILDGAGLPISLQGDVNGDGIEDYKDIGDTIAAQKQLAFDAIGGAVETQLQRINRFTPGDGQANRDEVSRAMDFYAAGELRLPPNPLAQMIVMNMLAEDVVQQIAQGEQIFNDIAGCASCHDPGNTRAPFTDQREHGAGAGFIRNFITTYNEDPRLTNLDPLLANGVPDQMLISSESDFTPQETNFQYNPIDYFLPFCFTEEECLTFDNPLAVRGSDEETERLIRLALLNLADPDRGFIPGQVINQPRVNTPSLRGVWLQHNLLRHGRAFSIREAVLPPGHEALRVNEQGWAVNRRNDFDVHGETQDLTTAQVEALELFVKSIE